MADYAGSPGVIDIVTAGILLYRRENTHMGIIIAYSIIALLLLALATGVFKPRTWHELPKKYTIFLRFGCFFGFLVTVINIARRLM